MRGEFIGVWSETWREIWLPLVDGPLGEGEKSIPNNIFCELYREIAPALVLCETHEEDATDLILRDVMLIREAFKAAVHHVKPDMERSAIDAAFDSSGAADHASERVENRRGRDGALGSNRRKSRGAIRRRGRYSDG